MGAPKATCRRTAEADSHTLLSVRPSRSMRWSSWLAHALARRQRRRHWVARQRRERLSSRARMTSSTSLGRCQAGCLALHAT